MTSSVVLLAGGGIDSTLCMRILRMQARPFRALHIDFGQPAAAMEWKSVLDHATQCGAEAEQIIIRSNLNFEPGEIPGRNAALIFQAVVTVRPTEHFVQIGVHAGTPFYDCSPSFIAAMSSIVAECTNASVMLQAPLLRLTKPEIVAMCSNHGVDFNSVHSCQRAVVGGCGRCHSCLDRRALAC